MWNLVFTPHAVQLPRGNREYLEELFFRVSQFLWMRICQRMPPTRRSSDASPSDNPNLETLSEATTSPPTQTISDVSKLIIFSPMQCITI